MPKTPNIYYYKPQFANVVQINCPDISEIQLLDKNYLFAGLALHTRLESTPRSRDQAPDHPARTDILHLVLEEVCGSTDGMSILHQSWGTLQAEATRAKLELCTKIMNFICIVNL